MDNSINSTTATADSADSLANQHDHDDVLLGDVTPDVRTAANVVERDANVPDNAANKTSSHPDPVSSTPADTVADPSPTPSPNPMFADGFGVESDDPRVAPYSEASSAFAERGYRTVPIKPGSKHPAMEGWTSASAETHAEWATEYAHHGTGVLCGQGMPFDDADVPAVIAIDCDVHDPELSSAIDVIYRRHFGPSIMRVGREPAWLRPMRAAPGVVFRRGVVRFEREDGEPGKQLIELLGRGQQFVVNAVHPGTERPYRLYAGDATANTATLPDVGELPELSVAGLDAFIGEVIELMAANGWTVAANAFGTVTGAARTNGDGSDWLSSYSMGTDSVEDVRRYLTAQDASADNLSVFPTLAALFDWSGGRTEGQDMALEWLQSSPDHSDEEAADYLADQWGYLARGERDEIDIGDRRTIGHLRNAYEKHASIEARERHVRALAEATDEQGLRAAMGTYGEDPVVLDTEDATVIEAFRVASRALGLADPGVRGTKALLKADRALRDDQVADQVAEEHADLAGMLFDRYVRRGSRFVDLEALRVIGADSPEMAADAFDPLWQKSMPVRGKGGERWKPSSVLASEMFGFRNLRSVSGDTYRVNAPSLIEEGGRLMLNTYVQGSWPQVTHDFDDLDPQDARIADMIQRHLQVITNEDPAAVAGLVQWIADIRQNPHTRAHWAPAILSNSQGIGKSTLKFLFRAVLGEEQVQNIEPQSTTDDKDGIFGRHNLILLIEEPEANGKFDAKMLKDAITSNTINLRRMRRESEKVRIYAQFAIVGNFEGAMGQEKHGRRYMGCIPSRKSDDALAAILGTDPKSFFADYYAAMKEQPDRFAAYFESIDLEGFDRHSPPATRGVEAAKAESPEAIIADFVQELIDDDVHGDVGADVVYGGTLHHLIEQAAEKDPELEKIRKMSAPTRASILRDAMLSRGWKQLSSSNTAARLPFSYSDRVRMTGVFVRSGLIPDEFAGESEDKIKRRKNITKLAVERNQERRSATNMAPDPNLKRVDGKLVQPAMADEFEDA